VASLKWQGYSLFLGELELATISPASLLDGPSAYVKVHGLPVHRIGSMGSFDATNEHARTVCLERVQEALFDAGVPVT